MANTDTLISLAMLKVNIDQGRDYLDYLRPFILQVLVDRRPDPVTDGVVCEHLRTQFGLEIPARAVQIVLQRLSRKYPLERETGVYHITGALPDPGITAEKSKANRHIQAVVSGLLQSAKARSQAIASEDEAVTAICAFLSEFNIPCLRAYLRGTTIPTVERRKQAHIVLVSDYVLDLQRNDPERFESFMVLVQGHMLANALLCPDLQNAPKTYKGVTFYLDTPLLVQWLGLEGEQKKRAGEGLFALIRNLGGVVAVFSHSREELTSVLEAAARYVDSPDGRGNIIMEARRKGRTKSDFLLLAGKVDELLVDAGIEVEESPRYIARFQIDETAFGSVLGDEVSYFNVRAKENDINSVRSIYVLRANTMPASVEKCKAVLVSSNSAFARAAYEYGRQYEQSRQVSSVITDFSLANMAWLKAPMGAPSVPMTELLAYSYAALQPSKRLLDKYLSEIDKLQELGKISEQDHQLLRSSTVAQEELMQLTLGDEAALTEETITETLRRVSKEITKEESEKLAAEKAAHRETQVKLTSERIEKQGVQERVFWRLRRKARGCGWFIAGLIGVLLVVGFAAGFGLRSSDPVLGLTLTFGSGAVFVLTLCNLIFGTTVRDLQRRVENFCLSWFIRREAAVTGLDLSNLR
jgi:hypothetical protein